MSSRHAILTAALAVALCVAGCGGGNEPGQPAIIDQDQIEALVKERAEAGNGTVRIVTCPEDVEAVKDDTITCDFYFEGGVAGYADVRVTSADGDLSLDPKDLTFSVTD